MIGIKSVSQVLVLRHYYGCKYTKFQLIEMLTQSMMKSLTTQYCQMHNINKLLLGKTSARALRHNYIIVFASGPKLHFKH